MPGRLRVLRMPEALRACLAKSLPERAVEKIPQDIADRLCIFPSSLQSIAEKLPERRGHLRLPEALLACSAKKLMLLLRVV